MLRKKNSQIFKTVNKDFVNITDKLGIYNWVEDASYCSKLTEQINFFDNHPSVPFIMNNYQKCFNFKFEFPQINCKA